MRFSLRRWRPSHLVGAWIAWWCGAFAVTTHPLIAAAVRTASGGGSIEGGLTNDQLAITVVTKGGETLVASASVAAVAAVAVLPPLALWALWLRQRPDRNDHAAAPAALDVGPQAPTRTVTDRERAPLDSQR